MPECVDLRTVGPYRLVNELTGKKPRTTDDPWVLLIRGRSGSVSPYGGDLLLADTRSVVTTRRILAAVPDAVVTQDGDDGQNITFPAAHLETVAGILGLKRRRVVSEAQRARLAVVGKATRLSRNPGPQSDKSTRQATISGPNVSSVA
jgi:hypothetical protein